MSERDGPKTRKPRRRPVTEKAPPKTRSSARLQSPATTSGMPSSEKVPLQEEYQSQDKSPAENIGKNPILSPNNRATCDLDKDSHSESEDNYNNTETSKKNHDRDDADNVDQITKRIAIRENNNYYLVPKEFLEKLNSQNKAIWKNQLRQEKKLDKKLDAINKVLTKLQREDSLTPALIDKAIVSVTKVVQKISLHPTPELFKEHLEIFVEKWSKGYINDIGKHRWNARFYSEFMPICSEKMRPRRGAIAKDIRLALFKVFKNVQEIKTNASGTRIVEWKKMPQVAEAYNSLWQVDDNRLTTINKIIMKAMPKENEEDCLIPSIISFALAVCCIVLDPRSKDIRCTEEAIKKCCAIFFAQLNMQQIPSEDDIAHINDNTKDKYINTIEEEAQEDSQEECDDDGFEDSRLFE